MESGMDLTVPAEIWRDGGHFVSCCPPLDVYSQGSDKKTALDNLVEALQLFIGSCIDRGTLDQALKDCGFEADTAPGPIGEPGENLRMIRVPFPLVTHEQAHTC